MKKRKLTQSKGKFNVKLFDSEEDFSEKAIIKKIKVVPKQFTAEKEAK